MKYNVLFYVRDFDLAKNDDERARVIEDVKQRIAFFERDRDTAWNDMRDSYCKEDKARDAHENTYEFMTVARQKEEELKELLDEIEDYRKLLRFLTYETARRVLTSRMKEAQQS